MREILFRGKRLDDNEWAYGNLIIWNDGSACIDNGNTIDYMIAIDPETIGEYTGIKDKNGTKIFEGDITTAKLTEREYKGFEWPNAVTVFENGQFCRKDSKTKVPFANYTSGVEFEVIGNIHDNSDSVTKQEIAAYMKKIEKLYRQG